MSTTSTSTSTFTSSPSTPVSKLYYLPPTPLIPNSPYPLIHYPALLHSLVSSPDFTPTQVFDLFYSNAWQPQWIARYGPDIQSHFHSTTHEAMVVISGGSATIRFGVADSPSWVSGKYGVGGRGDGESGGLEIRAKLGDVFIVPAGVSHKTFDPVPGTRDLAFHQPQDVAEGRAAEGVETESVERHRRFFGEVEMRGEFMQMGAYPVGGTWDFKVGGEFEGREGEVWGVRVPERDPVLGKREEGLRGLWKDVKV